MAERVRIGFAGAGHIAGVHAGILAADDRLRVEAVFEPNLSAAELFALKTGARAVPSVDDLLGEIDALYICNPNVLHAALAVRALDAGLHVFSEKPMATSLADATAVRDAAARAKGIYQAGFNRRFSGVYRALQERITSGALVPLTVMMKLNRGELQRPAWTGDASVSGGFLYETPVHMFDIARVLFGEPAEIICRASRNVYEQADAFSLLITFDSGVTAAATTVAHTTWLFPYERMEVYGDHAIAVSEELERITFGAGIGQPAEMLEFVQLPMEERWGYAGEDRLFADAICGGGEPAVNAEDALLTIAFVERCYEAAGIT